MLRRWALVGWAAAALAAASALTLAAPGAGDDPEPGIRALIRFTARLSLGLFLVVFAASSWQKLAPSRPSRWAVQNRRHLGLAMALSQLVHAMAILMLANLDPARFRRGLGLGTVGGLTTYLLMMLMVVTSFDGPTRWLGRKRWRILHSAGMYMLALTFLDPYGVRTARGVGLAVLPTVLLLGVRALRLAARRGRAKVIARSS
ncbi:MAG: ferric reductase-like transmembrane domain-containing protein [Deltaproteobacteria bacterium]|nr:ferric reductase-like transmembrane domain-containing protein [Deltaproteobacteria bacterium]